MSEKNKEDLKTDLLKEKEKFYEEENLSSEVKNVLDEVFDEMVQKDDQIENVEPEINVVNTVIEKKEDIVTDLDDLSGEDIDLKNFEIENRSNVKDHQDEGEVLSQDFKISSEEETHLKRTKEELEQKIAEYEQRYKKLELKIDEYEKQNTKLLEKRQEFQGKINEFEAKNKEVEERKEEFIEKSKHLDSAREQFKNLSKKSEEKKLEIEKLEIKLKKSESFLEAQKRDFEKKKIEIEMNKITLQSEPKLDMNVSEGLIEKDDLSFKKQAENEGKVTILYELLHELSNEGNFQSCFLIDERGMIISEYSNDKFNIMAIGAMFSLTCTSLLRTVDSLRLKNLQYFKLSSAIGEFILNSIPLSNYKRNFILLVYYDETNVHLHRQKKKLTRNFIKKILKNIKEELYNNRAESSITRVFDNLINKFSFLRDKYFDLDADIEKARINLLYNTSARIKHLFENY